jgi:hypothetical protein
MNSVRLLVAGRLAPFRRLISSDLLKTFDLTLRGSWGDNEYHAIQDGGFVRSYSDVDFTCDDKLSASERMAIEARLYETAASCGLEFHGVSVRLRSEIQNMFAIRDPTSDDADRREACSDFIQFWTLVGASEVCVALLRSGDDESIRYYHINKFFLEIWRDIGTIMGCRVRSYRETLRFAARYLPAHVRRASYALKVGGKTAVPWPVIQATHQRSLLCEIRRFVMGVPEQESIVRTVNDLPSLGPCEAELSATEMLTSAETVQRNVWERKAALNRLRKKLRPRIS